MKAMTAVFWGATAVVGVSLIMIIVTAVQTSRAEKAAQPTVIPVPAVPVTPAS